MKELLERLEELQAIDLRIREITRSRDGIPEKVEELLQETRQREEEVRAIEARIAEAERERRMLEEQALEYHDKLQKVQQVQGAVKNQKEYEALLKEMDGFRKHKSHFDDEVLRTMEILEDLGRTRDALQEAADQSRQAVDTEVKALEAQLAELDSRIATEETHRREVAVALPADVLKRYDIIRKRRMGLAVVRALDGRCAGCNMNLPPQFYNQIMRLASIEQCPSCNRILFFRAPEPQVNAS